MKKIYLNPEYDLYNNLDELFLDAFFELSGIDLSKNIEQKKNINKELKKLYQNLDYYYYNRVIGSSIEEELNKHYDELVEKSIKDEFLFVGSDYKTIITCVLRDKSKYNNSTTKYEKATYVDNEAHYIEEHIEYFEYTLKNRLVHILDLTKKYNFEDDSYILFLYPEKIDVIKGNLKKVIKILRQELKEHQANKTNEGIDFDLKLWNENCFKFFEFLIENYYTGKSRELTDIWHFLRKDFNEIDYRFSATQENYADFINKRLGVKLKNWQTSNYKYEDTEKPKLIDYFNKFKTIN